MWLNEAIKSEPLPSGSARFNGSTLSTDEIGNISNLRYIKFMKSTKRSKALKARWAKVPKEKRSAIASGLAKEKNKQMTKKQRVAHAMVMVKARKQK